MMHSIRTLSYTLGLCLALGEMLPAANGAEYYVSPSGDDGAAGTRQAPWQSLAKVNQAARAGDTITFLPGDYSGALAPANSGVAENPIVFRSEKPLAARLVGGNPAIKLERRSHIVIDGFHVEPANGACFSAKGCSHLTIQNCTMEGSRGDWNAIHFADCDFVVLRDNLLQRNLVLGAEGGKAKNSLFGHTVTVDTSRHFLIEGNQIGKGGHAGLAFTMRSENSIIRRNLLFAGWGRAMGLGRHTRNVLFEENVIVGAVNSAGSARPASPMTCSETIVRRNLVVRNFGLPLTNNFYMKGEAPVSEILDSRFYQNTVCENLEGAWAVLNYTPDLKAGVFERNIWQNNLVAHNDYAGDFGALEFLNAPAGNRFVRNLVFGDQPGQKTFHFVNANQPANNGRYTLAEFEQRFPDLVTRGIDADPKLADPTIDDYRLTASSPAIDAGDFLARALADGLGRQLAVDDSRCFHDGFGVPGEPGDLILVGAKKTPARVTAIDHEKGVLTLDRDIAWKAGDPVNTPYAGRAPDLGAMEFGAESEPWYHRLVVPAGSYFTPPADGAAPLITSDFEDSSIEQWGQLWNTERKRHTLTDLDSSTAASGKTCYKMFATAAGAALALDTEAYLWDLDAHPNVTFSYRIPPGVPVGIWLRPFEFVGQTLPAQTRVGGSPAMAKLAETGVADHELIDDNQWHTITFDARVIRKAYPGLRYLRGFDFSNSCERQRGYAKEGAMFWLDDFSIAPQPPAGGSAVAGERTT